MKLTDRREFEGKVIGVDERTDVAVIKINAKGNLPVVRIGDSSKLRPGQWVLAIGSPFGFENTRHRRRRQRHGARNVGEGGNGYVPFIQTDVAVNPGNSGGPLFNLDGEVVGINSQIYSRSGGYEGISFAIPIDVASNVADQLIKTGHVSRGRIGVTIQQVTAATAENLGLDRPRGAAVASVESGGPADKAGIEPLDIILSVNGKQVDSSDQLPAMIAADQAGPDRAAGGVARQGGQAHRRHGRGAQGEDQRGGGNAAVATAAPRGDAATVNRIGLSVRALTRGGEDRSSRRAAASSWSMPTARRPRPGLRGGDVILSINRADRSRASSSSRRRSRTPAIDCDAADPATRRQQQSIVTITLQ